MLVLERKLNDSVFIGDQVTVKVLTVKGSRVRLGIEAPKELNVHKDACENTSFGTASMIRSVLVLEPNGHAASLIADRLYRRGVSEVYRAQTVPASVATVESYEQDGTVPDLVLADASLFLDEKRGESLGQLLRSKQCWRGVPIIAWSDACTEREARRCVEHGATAYIQKHLRDHRISETLGQILWFWSTHIRSNSSAACERMAS